MPPTLKDVAARAGVSRSAVSRTFTPGASVSAKTRALVEHAANALGYSPNALASSLTTGRTKLIGLVSNNFHNPVFLQVFDLLTRGLQTRGLRPLLVNLSDQADPEVSLRLLRQYSVDGVIVASSTLPPSFAAIFGAAGVPVVHAFGKPAAIGGAHVVGIDNVECGRMAARTLIARGYTDVAFLGGPAQATSSQDRLQGFAEALAPHPHITMRHSFADAYSFDAGQLEMTRLLQSNPARAFFCGDDVLSIGAICAIQAAGMRVPQDIGIIGLNDMEMARWGNINLTTIRQPITEMIATSLDLIATLLAASDQSPQTHIFACRIIERGTLRPIIHA